MAVDGFQGLAINSPVDIAICLSLQHCSLSLSTVHDPQLGQMLFKLALPSLSGACDCYKTDCPVMFSVHYSKAPSSKPQVSKHLTPSFSLRLPDQCRHVTQPTSVTSPATRRRAERQSQSEPALKDINDARPCQPCSAQQPEHRGSLDAVPESLEICRAAC